jgi:RimJ/RimL family protein N-acetyltransferase
MVTLKSERLIMRDYNESDLPEYHRMMSDRENIPTQKVMVKVGFRKEAEKPNAMWLDGQMRDRLEFALNRDEYLKMHHEVR